MKNRVNVRKVVVRNVDEEGGEVTLAAEEVANILLPCGTTTICDVEDLKKVSEAGGSWWAANKQGSTNKNPYVTTKIKKYGKRKGLLMHRLITDCPEGMEVHHKNGDVADNRKGNLECLSKKSHREKTRLQRSKRKAVAA